LTDTFIQPLADIVSGQYEKWFYPEPIVDLDLWLQNNWQWFDPSHAHRIFWPNQDYRPELDILIAGCGTNQAAVFAYNNPQAKVVAIDVSKTSLDHQYFLKDKYRMTNLELHLLPIEEVGKLNRDFDLIVSTGVLHHLADPLIGLRALSKCIRQDGVVALMLYAKYGRIGVEILQSVARDLGLQQTDDSVLMVKEILRSLPESHPVKSYVSIAPDLQFDAGLVDTFLHGRDRSYSIDNCIELVTSSGLVLQDMFIKSPYYPGSNLESVFHSSLTKLPDDRQWSIMERINTINACHFFTACRRDRPQEQYKIDFKKNDFLNYIPTFRYRCSLTDNLISRYDWNTLLSQSETLMVSQIDGKNNIAQIILKASKSGLLINETPEQLESFARTLFQRLWQLDLLAINLS